MSNGDAVPSWRPCVDTCAHLHLQLLCPCARAGKWTLQRSHMHLRVSCMYTHGWSLCSGEREEVCGERGGSWQVRRLASWVGPLDAAWWAHPRRMDGYCLLSGCAPDDDAPMSHVASPRRCSMRPASGTCDGESDPRQQYPHCIACCNAVLKIDGHASNAKALFRFVHTCLPAACLSSWVRASRIRGHCYLAAADPGVCAPGLLCCCTLLAGLRPLARWLYTGWSFGHKPLHQHRASRESVWCGCCERSSRPQGLWSGSIEPAPDGRCPGEIFEGYQYQLALAAAFASGWRQGIPCLEHPLPWPAAVPRLAALHLDLPSPPRLLGWPPSVPILASFRHVCPRQKRAIRDTQQGVGSAVAFDVGRRCQHAQSRSLRLPQTLIAYDHAFAKRSIPNPWGNKLHFMHGDCVVGAPRKMLCGCWAS